VAASRATAKRLLKSATAVSALVALAASIGVLVAERRLVAVELASESDRAEEADLGVSTIGEEAGRWWANRRRGFADCGRAIGVDCREAGGAESGRIGLVPTFLKRLSRSRMS